MRSVFVFCASSLFSCRRLRRHGAKTAPLIFELWHLSPLRHHGWRNAQLHKPNIAYRVRNSQCKEEINRSYLTRKISGKVGIYTVTQLTISFSLFPVLHSKAIALFLPSLPELLVSSLTNITFRPMSFSAVFSHCFVMRSSVASAISRNFDE